MQLPFVVTPLCGVVFAGGHWPPSEPPSATGEARLTENNKPPPPNPSSIKNSQGSKQSTTMAAGQKLYPRATIKKIVKAHSKHNVSKNVDVLVCFHDASFTHVTDVLCRYFWIMLYFCRRMPPT